MAAIIHKAISKKLEVNFSGSILFLQIFVWQKFGDDKNEILICDTPQSTLRTRYLIPIGTNIAGLNVSAWASPIDVPTVPAYILDITKLRMALAANQPRNRYRVLKSCID